VENPEVKSAAEAAHIGSVVLIYGGAAGVLTGIVTRLLSDFADHPASASSCVLCVPFFSIFLALWLMRHFHIGGAQATDEPVPDESGLDEETRRGERGGQRAHTSEAALFNALNCAAGSLRKAPMMAVLFMLVSIRAQRLGRDAPPPEVLHYLKVVVGLFFLELLASAVLGAVGQLDKSASPGEGFFTGPPPLLFVRYMLAISCYFAMLPVANAIVTMSPNPGKPKTPLSASAQAVLVLQAIYFVYQFVQNVCCLVHDVFANSESIEEWRKLRDGMVNAGLSNRVLPAVCILFATVQMHILAIAGPLGAPQGWVQESMFVVVFACGLQALCCMLTPLLIEKSFAVDEDGHPEVDCKPWILVCSLAMLKHTAMLLINAGVVTVCIGNFMLTREKALRDSEHEFDAGRLMRMVIVALLVAVVACFLSSARALGMAIKFAVESVDRAAIGTDIEVHKVGVNLLEGRISVKGLQVLNPGEVMEVDQEQWRSDCLLSVDHMSFDMDIWKLICSFGKQFQITEIQLHGAHVYVEKPSFTGTSNIKLVMDFCNKPVEPTNLQKQLTAWFDTVRHVDEETPNKEVEKPRPKKDEQKNEEDADDVQVLIERVSIHDVGATAIPPHHFGHGFTVQLGDIDYEHLSDKMKHKKGAIKEVVSIILHTLLSTVAANTHTALTRHMMGHRPTLHEDDLPPSRTQQLGATAVAICSGTVGCTAGLQVLRGSSSPSSGASPHSNETSPTMMHR